MASGCILGKCPLCNEWIWEDEDFIVGPKEFYHRECIRGKKARVIEIYDMSQLEKDINKLKENIAYCLSEIERLENLLKDVKGREEG